MYERILVPVDGSATSNAGLIEATKLAKLTGARVRLLHVIDDMPFMMAAGGFGAMTVDVLDSLKTAGEAILQEARARVETSGVVVSSVLLDSNGGRLCDQVIEQADSWGADLLVLGTHGRRGVRRMLLGSDAEQIVRTATIPVLLVREERETKAPDADR
jgi:nucleotide-binding universal stress UspA family protein